MNEQWMKLVPNMIYSRKIEFSFWVRLVPVRGVHTQLLTPGAPGQSTPHCTLRPLLAHLHICYYIWQRKGILLILFQSSYCQEKLRISRMMT